MGMLGKPLLHCPAAKGSLKMSSTRHYLSIIVVPPAVHTNKGKTFSDDTRACEQNGKRGEKPMHSAGCLPAVSDARGSEAACMRVPCRGRLRDGW